LKKILPIAFLFTFLCVCSESFSQSYSNLEFVENKGQWDNLIKFRGLTSTGAFYLQKNGYRVLQHNTSDLEKLATFFHGDTKAPQGGHVPKDKQVSVSKSIPTNPETAQSVKLRSHAYDVQFLNSGNPTIIADKPLNAFSNYFIGNDPSKWAADCKTFQAVTYQNMYPNVNVRYYTNNGQLKYDIIAHPGADISKIALKFDGADEIQVRNGQLIIKTSVGEMRELAPYSYQIEKGLKKEVRCDFVVSGNVVRFNIPSYSKNTTLVIDPTLIFSTFTGSTADNWGYTATYGPDGSFYAGGIVFGAGFLTSPGAFQTNYAGGATEGQQGPVDIGIMKFSSDGVSRIYATYIGGKGNEFPQSMVVNAQGELVIGGRTSSVDYPTRTTNVGPCKNYDIVLTKLNAAGNDLVGSMRIGGTENDGVNIRSKYEGAAGVESLRRNYGDDSRSEVILDNAGNIYLASSTQSGDFPVTANAFQRSFGSAGTTGRVLQDGVLLKANPSLTALSFSSFIGGKNEDAAFVLALNPLNNNIYVGGNTVSTDLPGDKSGVVYSGFQGGACDGFVSIVSNDGSTLIKTTYIGTTGNDMLYGVQFDAFGYPYVMGTTSVSFPVINAAFSQAGGKQYISKLKPDLSGYEYSTNFGTQSSAPNLSPVAFLVDRCQNVYVSGWGGDLNGSSGSGVGYPNSGTTGLTTTPDAIQSKTDNSDFYFFVLEKNASSQLYGSFFGQFSPNGGGEHVDGGTSRFDRNGVIYQAMCANCGRSATFPTTPGVWSPTNGSINCNLAAVKIAFNLAGISSSIRASINGVLRDTSGCVPLTVDFADTVAAGQSYIWNFGDGSPDTTTLTPNASHTFLNIGSYRVRLISVDSTSCNIRDTAYTTIRVRNDEALLSWTSVKTGPCESTTYQFTNTSTAPAGKPFSNTSFKWFFGDGSAPVVAGPAPITHTFPGVGTYNVSMVLLDTNYCNAPDSVVKTMRISPNVDARFETPPSGCAPYSAAFKNTSAGGQQFFWSFGDGTTSNVSEPVHLYDVPGTYTIRLTVVDSSTCNISDSTQFTITVSQKPEAGFAFSPKPPQENTPVQFTNTSLGATNYKWDFGDGDTLLTTSTAVISHIFNETKAYNTCLIARNQFGCTDTVCAEILAKVVPLIDVPNAFTPNGDGVNDKVFVRGYGIAKMTWQIYNRWGALVFQTTNRSEGWDGTYKGSIQPTEVYHYVLIVEFSDGVKYQKKGDITLL
jgi:gliding motility-associated-like protein